MLAKNFTLSAEGDYADGAARPTFRERAMQTAFGQWFEIIFGYTMSTHDFIAACHAIESAK